MGGGRSEENVIMNIINVVYETVERIKYLMKDP